MGNRAGKVKRAPGRALRCPLGNLGFILKTPQRGSGGLWWGDSDEGGTPPYPLAFSRTRDLGTGPRSNISPVIYFRPNRIDRQSCPNSLTHRQCFLGHRQCLHGNYLNPETIQRGSGALKQAVFPFFFFLTMISFSIFIGPSLICSWALGLAVTCADIYRNQYINKSQSS